jgi:5-methylcytosine-specific restriction endonuclease McrA
MWSGTTSLPEGQAKCRVCRSADREIQGDGRYFGPERLCVWCSETHRNLSRLRTCSRTCGQSLRQSEARATREPNFRSAAHNKSDKKRANRLGVEYELIDRQTVYLRDKWICGICKGAVNPGLKYPNKGSASLDHIIPISKGGPHLYINVQCAHLGCNWHKRDNVDGVVVSMGGILSTEGANPEVYADSLNGQALLMAESSFSKGGVNKGGG